MRRSSRLRSSWLRSFVAVGLLLLASSACDTATAQETGSEAPPAAPAGSRSFPELAEARKPLLGRLFEEVSEEVGHVRERAARIVRGTGEGVRSLLHAGYDALPRRVVLVEDAQEKAVSTRRPGAPSDAELDEMLQRLDALQTPPIRDMGDRPRRRSGATAPSERDREDLPFQAAAGEEGEQGTGGSASARGLLQRLEARGDLRPRGQREATAYSHVLPPQLVQAGFQDWQQEPKESSGFPMTPLRSPEPRPTCLDEQRQRVEPLRSSAAGGSDDQAEIDAIRLSGMMPDQVQLLADGSLFVPKLTQRLLDIRTLQACAEQVPQIKRLAARIVGNPNAGGLVQAAQVGRIRPGPNGLPELGQRVRAGEPLGVLEPIVSSVERGQLESQLAELRSQIIDTELQLARMRDFPIVPFRSGRMLALRLELDGLRKRRDHLIAGLDNHEVLLSPVDGLVSRADTRAGQLVQTGDTLWEVVDPQRLRVEAVAPADFPISAIRGAHVLTSAGESLELNFVGQGALGDDVALQFELQNEPAGLVAGTSVTLLLEAGPARPTLVLPREALLEGHGGRFQVWEHLEGERFVARALMAESLDETTVAIPEGLAEGARIVHQGVNRLAALR